MLNYKHTDLLLKEDANLDRSIAADSSKGLSKPNL
jgi:hypothetical protein